MNSDAAAVRLLDEAMGRLDELRLQLLGLAAPMTAVTETVVVRETVVERCKSHCPVCYPPRERERWSWRNAVEAAGLPEGTRFHDLRHFYASTLIAANLHPKVVQSRLRHATLAETMDTYGHLFPDHEELGRGALDAAFAPQDQKRSALDVP